MFWARYTVLIIGLLALSSPGRTEEPTLQHLFKQGDASVVAATERLNIWAAYNSQFGDFLCLGGTKCFGTVGYWFGGGIGGISGAYEHTDADDLLSTVASMYELGSGDVDVWSIHGTVFSAHFPELWRSETGGGYRAQLSLGYSW